MSQGFQQVQKQTQSLILAPQLRHSLKILQAPALELRNSILEELQSNPILEEMPMDGTSLEANGSSNETESSRDDTGSNDEEMDFGGDYEMLHKLNEDWKEYFAQESSNNVYSSEDAQKRQHMFDSLVAETSLQQHLMDQAQIMELEPEMSEAIEYLIGSLDDKGFLTTKPADIALIANLPFRPVMQAHEILKGFDPPGIACLDLQDSLLQQLKLKGRGESLASKIIKKHYPLLLRRRIPEMARKLSATVDEIHNAIQEIADLNPTPASRFTEDNNRVISPDVRVEKNDDEWQIILNSDYIPRLRLNNTYKEMIAQGKINSKEKEYIQDKIRSGKFLINSIDQRQRTIERITREILKFQAEFFEEGVSKLKPLTMNQVAQEVGVHETTVSRAVANKYIETPFGIFDFKYFFTSGYQSADGSSVSNTSIKDIIAHLIENEDPRKPLSDQEVVNILAKRNLKIARRTAAKYREEMGILPTNLRRQYS